MLHQGDQHPLQSIQIPTTMSYYYNRRVDAAGAATVVPAALWTK